MQGRFGRGPSRAGGALVVMSGLPHGCVVVVLVTVHGARFDRADGVILLPLPSRCDAKPEIRGIQQSLQ